MKSRTIEQIKTLFQTKNLNESMIEELRTDKRKGVQNLLAIYDKQVQRKKELENEFWKKFTYDNQFRLQANDYIAGVDEAGRGPLAGPVVAAAVILPTDFTYFELNDSKQLTEAQREKMFHILTQQAISYSISTLSAEDIDQLNIYKATKQAMRNALRTLNQNPTRALIDAMKLDGFTFPTMSITKGDTKSLAIAAASILAKVTRDRLMIKLDKQYPMYDFKNNKGYGTQNHLLALEKYGPTVHHRKSFSPVQDVLQKRAEGR